jgi:CRISPR/Cas system-associated protein endoribonuclease Cas2
MQKLRKFYRKYRQYILSDGLMYLAFIVSLGLMFLFFGAD